MNSKANRKCKPDFDELMVLAMKDPDAFENERQKFIDSFIDNVPQEKRHRLLGLQWKIDQTRKLAGSPMASCIAISNMMWDSLNQLNQHQREFIDYTLNQSTPISRESTISAKILPFNKH